MPSSPNSYYFPTHPVHLFLNASTLGIQQSSRHPHFKQKTEMNLPTNNWMDQSHKIPICTKHRYIRNRLHNLYIFVTHLCIRCVKVYKINTRCYESSGNLPMSSQPICDRWGREPRSTDFKAPAPLLHSRKLTPSCEGKITRYEIIKSQVVG